jgi:hypothetical protein
MFDQNHLISLPKLESSDVLAREIHIVVNGEERVVKTSPDVLTFKVPAKHGDQVSVFVVDIDNNGKSEPSESLDWLVVGNAYNDAQIPKRPSKPILISVEDHSSDKVFEDSLDSLEEYVEHQHCSSEPCEEIHEHCAEHKHCENPCSDSHEHCRKNCINTCN